jgi:hypothetical protein
VGQLVVERPFPSGAFDKVGGGGRRAGFGADLFDKRLTTSGG